LVPLSVGLLALCCAGVLVFFVLCILTSAFIECDVRMATWMKGDEARFQRRRNRAPPSSLKHIRVMERLMDSLSAIVYFASVKFCCSILGFVVAVTQLSFFVSIFAPVLWGVCHSKQDFCRDGEGNKWINTCIGSGNSRHCDGFLVDSFGKSFVYVPVALVGAVAFSCFSHMVAHMHASATLCFLCTADVAFDEYPATGHLVVYDAEVGPMQARTEMGVAKA